ncbi:polyamine aminopropyltransferase [Streptomyces luteolus]|uniref:Polyamine aminopropyltransferase n=1 Tax=Streptomyces luteolus TaxID=3043615 RepID=A0ABT6SYQ4_9ACTN|nr:polyamine aminopropyltransferase [Streptomyces sp. B-S-A12]MDI3420325.1 polyamine aminopropyltransferase [Streptomyces sp. B-S-A12]
MIESPLSAPPGAPPSGGPEDTAVLPVSPRAGRLLVLVAVFISAACGLVYELELVALASYLIGDSVTQASVVLSVMVFAMGIGSLLAKHLRCRAAAAFGAVEAALALVGGCSALALYAGFVWGAGTRVLLVAFSLAIGVLIGAEVPLLMTLIQRIRRQDAGGAVADLFAADYVGALVGGLAFPFLLLPLLGQLTGALLTGAVNAIAGGALVLWLFRHDLSARTRRRLLAANLAVLVLLATLAAGVGDFERAARRTMYGADVRVALRTDVREIVLTGGEESTPGSFGLYLDGRLRAGGRDAHRYHEALVHPAMRGPHARVLILGGGDGLAAREVLRHPGVDRVDVVVRDAELVDLARTDPALSALNAHAYDNPRLHVVHGDAFQWLREPRTGGASRPYDVVIADLPEPGGTESAKLYSQEFFGLATRALAPGGRLAVHAGAAGRPRVFWTVEAGVRAAGLRTAPYRVGGRREQPGTGRERAPRDWAFLLASRTPPRLGLDARPARRSLTPKMLRDGARAIERTRVPGLPPSTLVHPRYAEAATPVG